MRSDAPSHVLSALTLCPALAGGLYSVPLGTCSRGSREPLHGKKERGENRRKQKDSGGRRRTNGKSSDGLSVAKLLQ